MNDLHSSKISVDNTQHAEGAKHISSTHIKLQKKLQDSLGYWHTNYMNCGSMPILKLHCSNQSQQNVLKTFTKVQTISSRHFHDKGLPLISEFQ
jgi:hypothetical protein